MKYVIMGSGGTGASIGGFLANAGHDVTLIARGNHLNAICQHGLILHSDKLGEITLKNIKAMTTDEYISSGEKADVIFVAVKGYSINEIIPFLQKASDTHTIIIPILNIYGTGRYLAEKLPQTNVLEGCIYIVAYISAPGEITQSGDIFRIVYGTRGPSPLKAQLLQIKQDLENSGIKVVLSENIADAGGLSCALEAAKEDPQADISAFFINWARIWGVKASLERQKLLLAIDVHAPHVLRANMQPKNLADFYTTFNIQPGDKMWLAPADRVNIW